MHENSFGIIPLKKNKAGKWQVLLVQHRGGSHWSFPKGHAEEQESPFQAACRELQEETGLSVAKLLLPFPLHEDYKYMSKGRLISKTVTYFVATTKGKLSLQHEEVSAAKWVALENATLHLTFSQGKNLSQKALSLLEAMKHEE